MTKPFVHLKGCYPIGVALLDNLRFSLFAQPIGNTRSILLEKELI
jgi:hypothetical protein